MAQNVQFLLIKRRRSESSPRKLSAGALACQQNIIVQKRGRDHGKGLAVSGAKVFEQVVEEGKLWHVLVVRARAVFSLP
jgi:hypothetical protein